MELPLYAYIHCEVREGSEEILREQILRIKKSALYPKLEALIIGMAGEGTPINEDVTHTIYTNDVQNATITLEALVDQAKLEDCYLLYMNTGSDLRNARDIVRREHWRRTMEWFLVNRHRHCLQELETHDLVGILWDKVAKSFVGNFWWARSDYINRLPDLVQWSLNNYTQTPLRKVHEMWVGSGSPRVSCLYPLTRDPASHRLPVVLID